MDKKKNHRSVDEALYIWFSFQRLSVFLLINKSLTQFGNLSQKTTLEIQTQLTLIEGKNCLTYVQNGDGTHKFIKKKPPFFLLKFMYSISYAPGICINICLSWQACQQLKTEFVWQKKIWKFFVQLIHYTQKCWGIYFNSNLKKKSFIKLTTVICVTQTIHKLCF